MQPTVGKNQNLYKMSYPFIHQDNRYIFETVKKNVVEVDFTKMWFELNDILGFFDENISIYEFQFKRVKFRSKSFDRKTSITILLTAFDFLNKNRIIFYSADSPTKKDRELFKLYDIWYKNNIDIQEVVKMNRMVTIERTTLYFSCFFRKDFVLSEERVAELFEKVLAELYPLSTISTYVH